MAVGTPDTCARPAEPAASPGIAPELGDPGVATDPAGPTVAGFDPSTAVEAGNVPDPDDAANVGPSAAGPDDGPANATTGAANDSAAIAASGTSRSGMTAVRRGDRPAGRPGRVQIDVRA